MRKLVLLAVVVVSSASGCRLFHRKEEPSEAYRYVPPPPVALPAAR